MTVKNNNPPIFTPACIGQGLFTDLFNFFNTGNLNQYLVATSYFLTMKFLHGISVFITQRTTEQALRYTEKIRCDLGSPAA